MLGTQAQFQNQYPTQDRPAKGRSWRTLIVAVLLLAAAGIGGWWAYQNGMAGQSQPVKGQPGSGQLPVSGAGASDTTAAGAQVPTAATGTSAFAASADQPAAQATTSTDQGPAMASLAGVAEVGGTPVWSDDGTLQGTLESGSILTVNARTSDDAWLAVATEAGPGWARSSTVIAYGLHNLAAAALPEALAAVSAQASSAAALPAAAASSRMDDAGLSLADLVSTSSSADGSQLAQAAAVQLTAKIAATGSRLNVRSGPGIDYQVVAKAPDGTEYLAVGRSAAGEWLLLSSNGSKVGWVSAGYVEVSGDIQTLPIEDA